MAKVAFNNKESTHRKVVLAVTEEVVEMLRMECCITWSMRKMEASSCGVREE